MKRFALALALLMIMSLAGGCWNYREVESLDIVAGFAVDAGMNGHRYHLTIDIANTLSAGKDKPVVSTLVETDGDTIFDAVRNAVRRVGNQLYWPDCQIAIVSQDIARDGILPVVDFLIRDAEPRLTMEIFVSQEKTAREVLQQQATTMSISSFEIDKMYEQNNKRYPITSYVLLYDINNDLASDSRSLTLPALKLQENNGTMTAALNGSAVFRHDKLVGFLNDDDSRAMLFITDQIKGGVLNVLSPQGNPIAALEVFSNKTAVTPLVSSGKFSFLVETNTEVALDELDTQTNYMDPAKTPELKELAEQQLEESIRNVIRIAETDDADIFGFGDRLHKVNPDEWNKVNDDWLSVFQSMEVTVRSHIVIRDAATGKEPVKVRH